MIALTLNEIAAITGGALCGVTPTAGDTTIIDGPVVTDSREASRGSLYVARIGETQDGHAFVGAARERGAVAALVSRPVTELPAIVVPDVQDAFAALAGALIDRSPRLTVIGVTGSSGKTSTKDLLGQVLGDLGETIAPFGSLNSEVGVPLTICRLTVSTRFLVVELGARAIGHVDYLTSIAKPRIGVVLNVGSAHLGEFGSVEAIAAAKAELVEALPPDGLAVLNADDDAVRGMAVKTSARVVLVGEGAHAEIRASGVTLDSTGRASFQVTTPVGSTSVTLSLVGRHQVGNALAALAIALEVGMPLERAAAALAAAGPVSRYRMEVGHRSDGVTIVNDAYNANPESMRAALESVGVMKGTRRLWALLGPMLELGPGADAAHAEIGALANARGVDRLVVVSASASGIAEGARAADGARTTEGARAANGALEIVEVPDVEAAYDFVVNRLEPDDLVLIKSSNGVGLRFLGDRLLAAEHPAAEHFASEHLASEQKEALS